LENETIDTAAETVEAAPAPPPDKKAIAHEQLRADIRDAAASVLGPNHAAAMADAIAAYVDIALAEVA